jgi:hypothetical protein
VNRGRSTSIVGFVTRRRLASPPAREGLLTSELKSEVTDDNRRILSELALLCSKRRCHKSFIDWQGLWQFQNVETLDRVFVREFTSRFLKRQEFCLRRERTSDHESPFCNGFC